MAEGNESSADLGSMKQNSMRGRARGFLGCSRRLGRSSDIRGGVKILLREENRGLKTERWIFSQIQQNSFR